MNSYISKKIKNISFLLMIMVVILHSYNIDLKHAGKILYFEKGFNWIFQNFISNGLTRIAVPLFFITSGYLFLLNGKYDLNEFIFKIKKRFRTLFVPYILWALIGLLFYLLLQSFPQSQPFFTKKLIKDYTFLEWLNAIFNEPIPYQLWFLKDLILMVIASPIIFFLVKKTKLLFPFVIFLFWIFDQDTIVLKSESLLFFSLGMYLRFFNESIIEQKIKNTNLYIFLWLVLLVLKTAVGFYDYSKITEILLLKASILIGILALWGLYDSIYREKTYSKLFMFANYSFFLYAFHEPFMTIVKKAIFAFLPKIPSSYLLVYIIVPLIVIIITIIIGTLLKRILLPIYNILTGSR